MESAEELHGSGINRRNIASRGSTYRQIFAAFFALLLATGVAQGRVPSENNPRLFPVYQRVITEKPVIQRVPLRLIDGDDIRFHQIHGVNSLSQTRATPTVQDRLGFLWFGTQDGLDRFDGYKFKVFRHVPGQSGSLNGVYVHKLFIDHNGDLWVGCDRALDKFDPVTETFKHFRIGRKGSNESFGPATDIKEDRNGKLWIATLKGLFMLDPATGQTSRFTHDPKDPSTISNDGLNFIDEDRQGTFWVASFAGLDAFDRGTGKVTRHIAMDGWFTFHEDKFGTFWIAGNASRCPLAVLDRNDNRLTCYSIYEGTHLVTSIAATYSMLESRNGTMWMGTEGGGLLRYDRERKRLVRYTNHPEDIESLGANSVISLFEDSEGQIWVDLHESMPYYFSEKPPLFENFTHQRGSLKGALVTAVYEDRNKVLWIGSTGGLNRIDRTHGKNTVAPGVGVKGEILSILEDPSGTLVAGSFREGLQQLNPATGQAEPYHSPRGIPSNQSTNAIMRLLFDHAGTLWAATWGGLSRFDPASGTFTTYKPDPVDEVNYSDIKEDGKGRLWLGGEEGLQRFDPKTGQFTVYKHDPDDSHSVSDHRVNSVFFDRSGGMWLGTQDGFDKFDPGSGTAKVYYEKDGLPGNVVSCILEDERGLLWMGTNNGLSSFDPRTETFKNYSVADGLPGPDLTGWSTCFRSREEEMFFGGFSGAIAFYPGKITDNSFVPRTVLTDFQLSGISVPIGSGTPLTRSITYTHSITLSHWQNIFAIEFSTLSYFNAPANRYRYKLEGLDREWHEVGSDQRMASYTTLPTAKYKFRVQGATSRGDWDEPGASLDIFIEPVFWQTLWFRTLTVFVGATFIWMSFLLRLRKSKERIEAQLGERMMERDRIARELHDTLLQGFQMLVLRFQVISDMISTENPVRTLMEDSLSRAEGTLREGRDKVSALRSESESGNDLAVDLGRFGHDLNTGSHTAFQLTVEGGSRTIHSVVYEDIQMIAREAIANSSRHAGGTMIECVIQFAPRHFRFVCRDNGCGIPEEVLEAKSKHGHWGLVGMEERAKNIGGMLRISRSETGGTEVELKLRAGIAYTANAPSKLFRIFRRRRK